MVAWIWKIYCELPSREIPSKSKVLPHYIQETFLHEKYWIRVASHAVAEELT